MASNGNLCWSFEDIAACCCWDPWVAASPGWSRLVSWVCPAVDVAPATVTLPGVLFGSAQFKPENSQSFSWKEQHSMGQEKNRQEHVKRPVTSGNASVAVSTDSHTSAVASQKLPVDDRPERCASHLAGLGKRISRHFCPEVPVAYVPILDGHAVAAEATEALDPGTLKVWNCTVTPLPCAEPKACPSIGTSAG